MSNEYKEWERDRAEEAWHTLNRIVDYYDEMTTDDMLMGDPIGDSWFSEKVKMILKTDGWID